MILIYMFFELLLFDICSLFLGKVCLILFVIFLMIKNGIILSFDVKKIIIKFCMKYIYDEV